MKSLKNLIGITLLLLSTNAFSAWIEDISGRNLSLVVYIGTFDPIHEGHQEIIDWLVRSGKYDGVVVIPNDRPLHKPGATAYETRLNDLRLIYGQHQKVYVPKEYRESFPVPMSISQIRGIKKNCRNCSFVGAFGDDILSSTFKLTTTRFLLSDLKKWLVFTRNFRDQIPKYYLGRPIEPIEFSNPESSSHIKKQLLAISDRDSSQSAKLNIHQNVLDRILFSNAYSNGGTYFKTGDIISFSLRRGMTPKIVQAISDSPFDHVGVLSWEQDLLFIYEFILGKGIVKSKLSDRWNYYRDSNGQVHFALAYGKKDLGEKDLERIKMFLANAADFSNQSFKSCTDFVLKSLSELGVTLKFDPSERIKIQSRVKSIANMEKYKDIPIYETITPVEILKKLNLVYSSEPSLHWTGSDLQTAWGHSTPSCLGFYK
ncbi:MAG: adenylyltransferase/cytidyltransferase family protein [Deltaproteobacteria bacterium]|nr:adenylyltransferase/cytidyltransferase family protein [Deltaproteobacteria bacterium]